MLKPWGASGTFRSPSHWSLRHRPLPEADSGREGIAGLAMNRWAPFFWKDPLVTFSRRRITRFPTSKLSSDMAQRLPNTNFDGSCSSTDQSSSLWPLATKLLRRRGASMHRFQQRRNLVQVHKLMGRRPLLKGLL
jgi:hypothetical protein